MIDDAPIIILNWNRWDYVFSCLQSLHLSEATNIWLVDNGSDTDRSFEMCNIYPELRYMKFANNYGWSGGYNRALRIAIKEGFEYAYLLNNDCEVVPGFLDATLAMILSNERIAVVGSRIVYKEPRGYIKFDGKYYLPGSQPLYTSSEIRYVKAVNGAGMLIRLRVLEKEGYFDERFFCYHEETEWCWRVLNRGWVCGVSDGSLVIHKYEGSDINANTLYYKTRNQFLLLKQYNAVFHKCDEKQRKKIHLIDCIIKQCIEVRRYSKKQEWEAIVSGLFDGLCYRFGKRPRSGMLLAKTFFWLLWFLIVIRMSKSRSGNNTIDDRVMYKNSVLPAKQLRFGGSEFKDDEYFLASARYEANRLKLNMGGTLHSQILDIGCGVGRLAIGILSGLGESTYYRGVDIIKGSIDWCTMYITKYHPGFRFFRLDVHNKRYNPSGKKLDDSFRFPFEDQNFDIIYLYSVFSHMTAEDIQIYLREFKRLIKPSGRIFATAFLEDNVPDVEINPQNYRTAWSGALHCVRYNKQFFEALLNQYDFYIDHFEYGQETDGQSAVYIKSVCSLAI